MESALGAEPYDLADILVERGGIQKHVPVRGAQEASRDELLERIRRILIENGRVFGRVRDLKKLRDELDIDETSIIGLRLPDIARAFFLLDHGAHLAHIGGGFRAISRSGQNLADDLTEMLAKLGRPCDGPGARQRKMLPGPGLVLLIGEKAIEANGHGASFAGGPKPHIDRVKLALGGGRGNGANETLRHARIMLRGLRRRWRGVIDDDEVDIGGRRRLAPAKLPHRDDSRRRERAAIMTLNRSRAGLR